MIRKNLSGDLSQIPSSPQVMDFSKDVTRTNTYLAKGYKKLQNEF